MSTKRIYVENDYDGGYGKFWSALGEVCRDRREFLSHPEDFDLIAFTGGEDVSPSLYKHRNLSSYTSVSRDNREIPIFNLALERNIPMSGICRGSQFLNVMCGGTMVQHLQRSHGGSFHVCRTKDGSEFEVTSSHHQMSVLGTGGVLLGWADEELPVETLVYDGDPRPALRRAASLLEEDLCLVTEAFAYPKQRVFGCQFHAEWMDIDSEAAQWQLQKTKEICWGEQTLSVG